MDLDALDTAYGAEKIDADLLETDIRSRLEYALADETRSVRNATVLMLGICVMSSVRSTTS